MTEAQLEILRDMARYSDERNSIECDVAEAALDEINRLLDLHDTQRSVIHHLAQENIRLREQLTTVDEFAGQKLVVIDHLRAEVNRLLKVVQTIAKQPLGVDVAIAHFAKQALETT